MVEHEFEPGQADLSGDNIQIEREIHDLEAIVQIECLQKSEQSRGENPHARNRRQVSLQRICFVGSSPEIYKVIPEEKECSADRHTRSRNGNQRQRRMKSQEVKRYGNQDVFDTGSREKPEYARPSGLFRDGNIFAVEHVNADLICMSPEGVYFNGPIHYLLAILQGYRNSIGI